MAFKSTDSRLESKLGALKGDSVSYQGSLDGNEKSHLFKFRLLNRSSHNFQLQNLERDVDLKLLNRRGKVLGRSRQSGSADESLSQSLRKGPYYIQVQLREDGSSSYTLTASSIFSQEQQQAAVSSLPTDGISREEMKLYKAINRYRAKRGQPKVRLSRALSTVANRHAIDLDENIGFASHSWSNAPYSPSNPRAMWEAPQRLGTGYPGYAYENIFGLRGYRATARESLDLWKVSTTHDDTMLNKGPWKGTKWKAMGVSIYKGFASVWFGEKVDPTGKPSRES